MILGGIRITLWFYAIYKYPRSVAKTKHSAMVNEWKKDVDCQLMTYVECIRVWNGTAQNSYTLTHTHEENFFYDYLVPRRRTDTDITFIPKSPVTPLVAPHSTRLTLFVVELIVIVLSKRMRKVMFGGGGRPHTTMNLELSVPVK